MPTNKKGMQSYLGVPNFISPFIPGYADIMAPLYDMTKDGFSWQPKDITYEHRAAFERSKTALAHTIELHTPDYSLPWRLQTDASTIAIGGILFQIYTDETGKEIRQIIGVYSKKLSPVAQRSWPTIKAECFAIVACLHHWEDLLYGKDFLIECDHRNLAFDKMSMCTTPILLRWKLYAQNFNAKVIHVS